MKMKEFTNGYDCNLQFTVVFPSPRDLPSIPDWSNIKCNNPTTEIKSQYFFLEMQSFACFFCSDLDVFRSIYVILVIIIMIIIWLCGDLHFQMD
jgi:hypothetical protein